MLVGVRYRECWCGRECGHACGFEFGVNDVENFGVIVVVNVVGRYAGVRW